MWKQQILHKHRYHVQHRISPNRPRLVVDDFDTGDACRLLLDPRAATWDRRIRMPALNPMHCYRPWKWEPWVVSSFSVFLFGIRSSAYFCTLQALLVLSMEVLLVWSGLPIQWYTPFHAGSIGLSVDLHSGVSPSLHCYWIIPYWVATGLRSNILKLHYQDNASPKQRSYVSALSGGIAGGGVTRLMGIHSTDR